MPKIQQQQQQQQQQQDQIKNLRFLRIVKRFPEIYNPGHDLANDKAHSMVVWDKISCELDTPVNALKKKWQKLCTMHKKKFNSNNEEASNNPSSSKDEIFQLIGSMLKVPGAYHPCDTDDGSLSSAPTLSIISEEGGNRSTRSGSSSSSTLIEDGEDRPGEGDDPTSFEKEHGSSAPSLSQAMAIQSFSSSSSASSSASSGNKMNANFSTRVLRSHNLRLNRTTRSGPPEITVRKNLVKDSNSITKIGRNSRTNLTKNRYSSGSSVNRAKIIKRSNETIGKFFQNLAITLAKFPNDIRNDARMKISKIVNDAEIELKSSSSNSI